MGRLNLREKTGYILLELLFIVIIVALVWWAIWYLRKDTVEFWWVGGFVLALLPPIVVCLAYDFCYYEFLGESSPKNISFWRSIIPVLIAGFIGLAGFKWMVEIYDTSLQLAGILCFLIPIILLPLITFLCFRIVFFIEDLFFLIRTVILPSNSKTLMNLAIKNEHWRGKTAVAKITDQELLIKIVKEDSAFSVKEAAIEKFDEEHKRLIPEIVEEVWQKKWCCSPEEAKATRDFIQFAYKISHQEQKEILRKYDGKVVREYTDVYEEYMCEYPPGETYTMRGEHIKDIPEVSIHFPSE
jgi:hypothetical protein